MNVRTRRIPVKNRERAIAFYSALLGIELEGLEHALIFDESEDDVTTLLHFDVADRIDAALEVVWSKGGCVLELGEHASGSDYRALVLDCEGNRIALCAEHAAV